MERHWTLDLVAVLGVVAGFVLAARGEAALAGFVAATSTFAVVLPEFVDSPDPEPDPVAPPAPAGDRRSR